jgi:hypothetical protein
MKPLRAWRIRLNVIIPRLQAREIIAGPTGEPR